MQSSYTTDSELVKTGFKIGMVQDEVEIFNFIRFVRQYIQDPQAFLEIGTKYGGTFYILTELFKNARGPRISLDLPGGIHGGWVLNEHPYLGDVNTKRDEFLKALHPKVKLIAGNSHDDRTMGEVYLATKAYSLDLLFIDGDHTYEGVAEDFRMYRSLVRKSGLVVFHDINDTDHHREIDVGVPRFWRELGGYKIEISSHKHFGGIGIWIAPE